MADKITLRLDAEHILPLSAAPVVYQDVRIASTERLATQTGVWVEPYRGTLMIKPVQFGTDSYLDTDITRHPKSQWVLTSGDWDDVSREEECWLLSDGTTEEIESKASFLADSAFVIKFLLFGSSDDYYEALRLTFGQWTLDIHANGAAILAHSTMTPPDEFVAKGSLCLGDQRLTGQVVELAIMPMGDRLYIRRNGTMGFYYDVPADWRTDGVIEAGSFKVQSLSSARFRFEFSQLLFPTGGTYQYDTPVMTFPTAPTAEQSLSLEVNDYLPGPGGYAASILTADGDPFVADGSATEYKVRFVLTGDATGRSSPMIFGARVEAEPLTPDSLDDPTDITTDVRSLTIRTGDSVLDTTARFVIRAPESHPVLGACNRLVTITAGDDVVFTGVLLEPPRYLHADQQASCYECVASTLAKNLVEPCIRQVVQFDATSHVDAVKWLCYMAGLVDADMELMGDTKLLPDTRRTSTTGEITSDLQTELGDRPIDWINRIQDLTGWRFTDGFTSTGDFVMKYEDPFALATTSDHTFYFRSDDETEEYQRIYRWSAWSTEPEANELYVYGVDKDGKLIAGRYLDQASQDGTLAEADRPDNWLGLPRIAAIPVEFTVTPAFVQEQALIIGREISQQRYFATFEADYPVGLWKGKIVTIHDSSATKIPGVDGTTGVGLFRILRIVQIDFKYELPDVPVRRALYEAVRVDAF